MSCPAAMAFSEQEMAGYNRDGFIVRRRIFAAQEVKRFQVAADRASIAALALCEQGHSYALDGKRFVKGGAPFMLGRYPVMAVRSDPCLPRIVKPPWMPHPLGSEISSC